MSQPHQTLNCNEKDPEARKLGSYEQKESSIAKCLIFAVKTKTEFALHEIMTDARERCRYDNTKCRKSWVPLNKSSISISELVERRLYSEFGKIK